MAIVGDAIMIAGESAQICGFVWHTGNGSTSQITAGSSSSSVSQYAVDTNMFSYSNGVFTCIKPGDYELRWFARGSYSSGGAARYVYFHIWKSSGGEDDEIYSVTGNTIPNGGASGVTDSFYLNSGDTIWGTSGNNTGATAHGFGYAIVKV